MSLWPCGVFITLAADANRFHSKGPHFSQRVLKTWSDSVASKPGDSLVKLSETISSDLTYCSEIWNCPRNCSQKICLPIQFSFRFWEVPFLSHTALSTWLSILHTRVLPLISAGNSVTMGATDRRLRQLVLALFGEAQS